MWPFKRRSALTPAQFWEWFGSNAEQIRTLKSGNLGMVGKIQEQLRRVDEALAFEVAAGEPWQFIVSADGRREAIPAVRALVAVAPLIDGWEVIAFKPRTVPEAGQSYRYRQTSLTIGDVWFQAYAVEGGLALVLAAAKGHGRPEGDTFSTCILLMDTVLGEYETMTNIVHAEFAWLPETPQLEHFRPLVELAEFVDSWSGKRS